MFGKLFDKIAAFYTASPFYMILICLAVGLALGFAAVAGTSTTTFAQVQPTTVQDRVQSTHPWKLVDHDNFRKVSNNLTYDDYQKYHRDNSASDAGVVMQKTQVGTAPGQEGKRDALAAAGHTPIDVIAVSEEDAETCHTVGACALVSPKALAVLNEKLGQLEKAQRKGAACI